MKVPPPLDLHSHLSPDVSERDLRELGAFIFGVTRSLEEFRRVANRHDVRVLWGVGAHPGLMKVQKSFDPIAFAAALDLTPLVAEVGLDGGSRVPMALQLQTFRSVLETVNDKPRLLSIHSGGAHVQVLRELGRRHIPGAILHWWTGSPELTEEAVRLGCHFSLPPALMGRLDSIDLIPTDRLLPETDHPAGDRRGPLPRQPGNLKEVELRLGASRGVDRFAMRIMFWRNLHSKMRETGVLELVPKAWTDVFNQLDT